MLKLIIYVQVSVHIVSREIQLLRKLCNISIQYEIMNTVYCDAYESVFSVIFAGSSKVSRYFEKAFTLKIHK